MSEIGRKITINTGVNWEVLSAHVAEKALEKARRDILPDITVRSLRAERRNGIHQGVWEVVAKLISDNEKAAIKVIKALNPSSRYIHDFDWENFEDHFGSTSKTKAWISALSISRESRLNMLIPSGADESIVGKKGDSIEGVTFRKGRDHGIAEALLEAYLIDPESTYQLMCLDIYTPFEKIHPLTLSAAIVKDGGIEAFKAFLGN